MSTSQRHTSIVSQPAKIMAIAIMLVMVLIAPVFSQEQASRAQTQIPVQVEILDGILQPGEYLTINGDFPGGNTRNGIALEQEGDGWSGSIRVPASTSSFDYQYLIIRPDGSQEPEWGDGRKYTGEEVIEDYFRGFGPTTGTSFDVEITLDLSELHSPYYAIQEVAVAGGQNRGKFDGLNWNFPDGLQRLDPAEQGLWTTTVQVAADAPVDLPVKFALKVDDVWDFEPLPYYKVHVLLLDPSAESHKVGFKLNNQAYRLELVSQEGLEADAYQKLTELYAGSRDYHYHLAMDLLKSGDPGGADAAYEIFKNYYPELHNGTHKNFYFTDKIESMGRDGLGDLALSVVEDRLESESDNFQRSYYLYLKGWLLRNSGRYEEARLVLQQSIDFANDEDAYHSQKQYARYALAMAYVQDPDPAEQAKARPLLEQFATTHTNQNLRRNGWQTLAGITRTDTDKSLHEQALRKMTQNGSEKQRLKSKIKWADYQLEHQPPDSAAATLSELLGRTKREWTSSFERIPDEVVDTGTDSLGTRAGGAAPQPVAHPIENTVERLTGLGMDPLLAEEIVLLQARYLLHTQESSEQARAILQNLEERHQGNPQNPAAMKARQLLRDEAKKGEK